MSEKARALGIPESHLTRALILVRNLRAQGLLEGIDPRALRIAILYLEKTDRYFCTKKLQPREMRALEDIAEEFFQLIHRSSKGG